ncbi:MAG: hypothetical protein LBL98_06210 [Ruminococcus sp.]|jgi:hypothetical protein|nr:hypothetical protein [Ruminococcus sp.]
MYEEDDREESRYGRDKFKSIDTGFIESGEYRRKFDCISENEKLNRSLYQTAKKILYHRSGTEFEDMFWLDFDTGKVFASITDMSEPSRVIYPMSFMDKHKHISRKVTIHNHPRSMPPSFGDFDSAYRNGYELGIVVCHDGTVYSYGVTSFPNKEVYDNLSSEFRSLKYSTFTSQLKTLEKMDSLNLLKFKEMTANDQLRRR